MTDEIDAGRVLQKSLLQANEHTKKLNNRAITAGSKRLCFVITKSKSNSWADDLYACGRIADLNRVYN